MLPFLTLDLKKLFQANSKIKPGVLNVNQCPLHAQAVNILSQSLSLVRVSGPALTCQHHPQPQVTLAYCEWCTACIVMFFDICMI